MSPLLRALIACSGPAAETGAPATTLPDATWSAAEVEAQVDSLLSIGLPDPDSLLQTYLAMFAGADPRCPFHDDYSMVGAFDGCTSDQGWLYAGVSTYEPADDGFWLLGDCTIIDDQGQEFSCSGELERVEDETGWSIALTGTWGYEGSETPWIAAVPGLALWVERDAAGLTLEGSYGSGASYAYFEAIRLEAGCATGTLWVRDPAGGWFTLDLDQSCDGCGALSYGDEALGEICVDLAAAAEDLTGRVE